MFAKEDVRGGIMGANKLFMKARAMGAIGARRTRRNAVSGSFLKEQL